MSVRKSVIGTILLLILVFMFSGCASIIKPGYQGVPWRPWGEGLEKEKTYDDGIVWHWPWNNIIEYETRWRKYSQDIMVLTSDDLHITVTVSIILRPKAWELYNIHTKIGPSYYKRVVKPKFFSVTRDIMADYIHNKIPGMSNEIEIKIMSKMKEQLKGKYLEIDSVTIDHVMYSKIVTRAADVKLATMHEMERKEYEKKIADADAEIQRISARGQRDAQKIIDEGLTKKYLQFKSLEVQEKLAASPNAKFFFVPLGKDGIPIIIDTGKN